MSNVYEIGIPKINNFRTISRTESQTSQNSILALSVRNACKSYDKGVPILNNLNISVKQGTIYGLLGASGCGKTTILSCIVGLNKLDEGSIKVFGNSPGSKDSGVPGKTIGFMPQDLSLYQVLSIREQLEYFGNIYGMSQLAIENKIGFLLEFLDLPPPSTLIHCLSGGQKRRVSLSIALLSNPNILILDEPTVGVDALLRESIWKHLKKIVVELKTAVLITTHYLEEASQCHNVGIMRNGRLLVEDTPTTLLKNHSSISLEEVFLKLCQEDAKSTDRNVYTPRSVFDSNPNSINYSSNVVSLRFTQRRDSNHEFNHFVQGIQRHGNYSKFNSMLKHHWTLVSTLARKNILSIYRNKVQFIISMMVPLLFTFFSCTIVGSSPKYTKIGVVNLEMQGINLQDIAKTCEDLRESHTCFKTKISCQFFDAFLQDDFDWIPYGSEKEALESVQKGKTLGFMVIPQNYTKHLEERAIFGKFSPNETLKSSSITARFDMSFQLKSQIVISKILLSFQTFLQKLAKTCGEDQAIADLAFKLRPIYGSESTATGFSEFLQPGLLMILIFFMPMGSSLNLVLDKKAGTLQRSIVAGVQLPHILAAFVVTEGFLVIIQLALSFGCMKFLFGFEIVGSTTLFLILCLLEGITGLSFGFFIGNLCSHEMEAIYTVLGLFLPLLSLSGITWPLQGLEKWAYTFCQFLPTTIPIHSLRSVSSRGWDINHPQVYPAFVVFFAWILITCFLSGIIYRKQK